MFSKSLLVTALTILLLISCKAQSNQSTNSLPKVENYSYGELDLKVIPFGMGKEIKIGELLTNGIIQFNWPEINPETIENGSIFMTSLKSALVGMSYCKKDQIEEVSKDCKVVNTQYIYLYKNDKQVGVLFPATERALLDNKPANMYSNLTLGSSLSWFYSDGTCNFKGNCIEKKEWTGKYNFDSQRIYDVRLHKGWNMVVHTLAEIEEFKDENGIGKLERKVILKSVDQIPDNIKWHIKTFVKLD